jgi:hypothetical protein
MRALLIGLAFGLLIGLSITLVLLSSSISMTGAAISSTGETITLPANTAYSAIEASFTIVNGAIEPNVYRIDARRTTELSVLAISGPAMLTIPYTDQSTPLLSNRQVHTFPVRIDEPGVYELICRPCGTQQSLESAQLIVI